MTQCPCCKLDVSVCRADIHPELANACLIRTLDRLQDLEATVLRYLRYEATLLDLCVAAGIPLRGATPADGRAAAYVHIQSYDSLEKYGTGHPNEKKP